MMKTIEELLNYLEENISRMEKNEPYYDLYDEIEIGLQSQLDTYREIRDFIKGS